MTDERIRTLCLGLQSPKVTERKKCCEDLFELLGNETVIKFLNDDNGEEWNWLFASVRKVLYMEVDKIEEELQKGPKVNRNTDLQAQRCNDLLATIMKQANAKDGVIDFKVYNKHFNKSLVSSSMKKYCLQTSLFVLGDYILPRESYWGNISQKEWTELFQMLKILCNEQVHVMLLKCIHDMIHFGATHQIPLRRIQKEVDFVRELCHSVDTMSPRWHQETVLKIFLEFCNLNMNDARTLCCDLGESVLNNFIQCYDSKNANSDTRYLIFEALNLQIRIHHPRGSRENDKLAQAISWTNWNHILQHCFSMVNRILKDKHNVMINNVGMEKELHPLFRDLVVEIYHQVCNFAGSKPETVPSTSAEPEPSSKRKCYDSGLAAVIDKIITLRDWSWINLITEILKKYPKSLSLNNFERLLEFLANYHTECKSAETRAHILKCLAVLIDVEIVLNENSGQNVITMENSWMLVWDSIIRSMGLNHNLNEIHNLLQHYFIKKKPQYSLILINVYLSKVILQSVRSIQSLDFIGQKFGISDSMPNYESNPKQILMHWILKSDRKTHYAEPVTAKVLTHLILKQWPSEYVKSPCISVMETEEWKFEDLCSVNIFDKEVSIMNPILSTDITKQYMINLEMYDALISSLQTITSEVIMKKASNIVEIVDTITMFGNLIVQMKHYKIENGEKSIVSMVKRILNLLWETLSYKFESLPNKGMKQQNYILSSVLKLLDSDHLINYIVRDSVVMDFVVTSFNIIHAEDDRKFVSEERENDTREYQVDVVQILCKMSIQCRNDLQQKTFETLIMYEGDPNNLMESKLTMTILKSLKERIDDLNTDTLNKILILLQKICINRHKEYNVALEILEIVQFLYQHVSRCNNRQLQNDYLKLLKPFYDTQVNYGPKVSSAVAKCMGIINKVDPEYKWSSWLSDDDKYVIHDLPQFLKFPCMEVRMTCIDNLVIPFLYKHIVNSSVYANQKKLFNSVCVVCREIYENDLNPNNPDEFKNYMSTVYYVYAMIIVNNSTLRQQALFELINFTYMNKFDKEKLKLILIKISKQLSLPSERYLLEQYLNYLLLQWNIHKYSLEGFPFELLNCKSDSQFYQRYMAYIIPILINEEDTTVFQAVCNSIGKSITDVVQVAHPKIIAKNLVLKSVKESTDKYKVSPEDLRFSENIQVRIKTYLPKDLSAKITKDQAHEILLNILQFVFDMEHFQKLFGVTYAIPDPDTTFLSMEMFMDTLDLLKEKVCQSSETGLIEYFITKQPTKLQQLLLQLKHNIYKATNIEDKVLAFHRYVILLEVLAPHFRQNHNLKRFLIRDISYTLINLIKYNFEQENVLNLLALKYLITFLDVILPHCSDLFVDFLVVVVSTLVSIVNTDAVLSSLSQDALRKLIIDNRDCLSEGLKILDPFPDNDKFIELRQVHFRVKYGRASCSLRNEIDNFMKVDDYIKRDGCRVEGLIHLKKQLIDKKTELKELYADLYKMKGCLADGSCLHRLICILVRLTTSSNNQESTEATRCLGELGSSDLTTSVLKNEERLDKYNLPSTIISARQIISLLLEYIVDEDIQVAIPSSAALHGILDSDEGKQIIAKNHDLNVFNRQYLIPFISNNATRANTHVQVIETMLMEVIRDTQLWCPDEPLPHREWIINLVTSILSVFADNSFYKLLIEIVKLKVNFAEKILPLLINVILEKYPKVFNPLSESIAAFFKKHWEFYWAGMINDSLIFMQKESVQCMLDIVNYVRLQRNVYKTNKNLQNPHLNLNYLHVALAAHFCSANFSTILYAEMWCRENAEEAYERCIQKNKNMTPFDIICVTTDQSKQLQAILRKTYIAIGDKDALHYDQLLDPMDMTSQMNMYKDLNRWDMMVLQCDIQASHGNTEENHMSALKNFALLNHAVNYKLFKDQQYECLWRLGKWDNSTQTQFNDDEHKSFDYCNYKALKAFNDNDIFTFKEAIGSARQTVVQTLRHASLECCQNLYTSLTQLQSLQELEDVYDSNVSGKLQDLMVNWKLRDSINKNDFQYLEPILSERICMLKIIVNNGNHEMRAPLIEAQLKLAELARFDGNLNIAKRAIFDILYIDGLDEHTKAKVMLEDAQIYWKIDKTAGIQVLKHLQNNYKDNSRTKSEALKLYGSWMIETKTESSKTIIANYFLESVNILKGLKTSRESSAEIEKIYDAYDIVARFADQEYQELHKYTNSAIFQAKVQNMEKLESSAATMEAAPNSRAPEVKKSIVVCRRQSAIDRSEISNTSAEKKMYLQLAVKYYLHNLQQSNRNNIRIFRIMSLWLENRTNNPISNAISEILQKLPSHKILMILPQLIPHITITNDNDLFGKQVFDVIERCAIDHPHHAIPIVLSIANSNKDDKYSDTSASTEVNEPRVVASQRLIQKLKEMPTLKNIIGQMELIADALIELAYYNSGHDANDKKSIKIPNKFKINSINNYTETIVSTYTLPVNILGKYENIVGIYKYRKEFNLVGGVNAPKRIKCIGTDGLERSQLVKGKDDLRQDAVMQQVFTIMNDLLAANKATSNLLIRTYKILPMSKRSGVLEWVDNSMPLGDYLVGKQGAHRLYNPNDISPDKCRADFKSMANYPYDKKLEKYLKICKMFKPAFHKFFETEFLQPTVWYEKRKAYTHSIATTSMCGYILGLGDRHVNNILIDKITAEVIHIDFGIAFEQGKVLPTPESVPFRLTRDIEAGMGISGAEGTFRRSCEKTMEVLRNNAITILTILEVLLYDPLYEWTITPAQAYSRQFDDEDEGSKGHLVFSNDDNVQMNVRADRALSCLKEKLQGTESGGYTSVEGQVGVLISQARDPANLCKLFYGWQSYL